MSMSMPETAMAFFDACETGKGWDVCQAWCHEGASFALSGGDTRRDLVAQGLHRVDEGAPDPDSRSDLRDRVLRDRCRAQCRLGVRGGWHVEPGPGEGGPIPPTGNTVAADYVYVMRFDGDKIRHMTKIWNDGHSLKQLGWA